MNEKREWFSVHLVGNIEVLIFVEETTLFTAIEKGYPLVDENEEENDSFTINGKYIICYTKSRKRGERGI